MKMQSWVCQMSSSFNAPNSPTRCFDRLVLRPQNLCRMAARTTSWFAFDDTLSAPGTYA